MSENKKEKIKISRDTNLAELVGEHRNATEVLLDYGLHCVGCALSPFDTLEQGAKLHGKSEEEIDEMVERINEVIKTDE